MRIRWKTWTPAHLHSAQNTGKPILLAITAPWCHWCHTMDNVTYRNPHIQQLIATHFTPIRVDTDSRPDINGRYNVGGWPSTVVLNLAGKVLGGATYLEPEQMRDFLNQSRTHFRTSPRTPPVAPTLPTTHKPLITLGSFTKDAFMSYYDEVNGGFAVEPKFPHHDLLAYLIQNPEHWARTMLTHTLSAMANSELHDAQEGGFYRYAAHADWTYPHFEKLLHDNAHLLHTYTQAYALTRNVQFSRVAKKTYQFLNTILWNGTGYSNSKDADAAYDTTAPAIDRREFTEPNAIAAIALTAYARTFKTPDALKRAHTILDTLSTRITKNGARHAQSRTSPHTLADTTALLTSLKTSASSPHQRAATLLERALLTTYYDPRGGFYDLPQPQNGFGLLAQPYKDFNENMRAVLALDAPHRAQAITTLRIWSADTKRHGAYAGLYELAARQFA